MDSMFLSISKRAPKENIKALRKSGVIPGIIYGNKVQNTAVKCKRKDLGAVFSKAGENTIVEVDCEGKKIPVLIHSLSFDPLSGHYEHVDFYAVDMTKKVTTHVPVVIGGESPAVKDLGGILVTVHNHLTVSCLPKDLPHSFIVNISGLKEFRSSIMVKDLKIGSGVTIAQAPDTVVVTIQEPREEEVIVPVATEAVAGAEGAAAAPTAEGAALAPGAATPAAAAPAAEKKEAKKKKEKKEKK